MKPFGQYTDKELLKIANEELNSAIRIEAIERGITPPITLSEVLRKSEYAGYQAPGESVEVYEIHTGGYSTTGIAYLSKERAEQVLEGMVVIDSGYGSRPESIKAAEPVVRIKRVGVAKSAYKQIKFEEFTQDNTEFDKVVEECMDRYSAVQQVHYNKAVTQEKRAEYMRLAGGEESIAKAFWAKAERTEWPEQEEPVLT